MPGAPDPLALVKAIVEDGVLAGVLLGPVAAAVSEVIAALDGEGPHPIAALAAEQALGEFQEQFGRMPAGRQLLLDEEANPAPARKPRIGFGLILVARFAHDTSSTEQRIALVAF